MLIKQFKKTRLIAMLVAFMLLAGIILNAPDVFAEDFDWKDLYTGGDTYCTCEGDTIVYSGKGAIGQSSVFGDESNNVASSYQKKTGHKIKHAIVQEGITGLGENTFCYLRSLETVELPAGLLDIGINTFAGCSKLTTVKIHSQAKVSVIPYNTFAECVSLQSITLPESVQEIQDWAFAGCTNLKTIYVPNHYIKVSNLAFHDTAFITDHSAQNLPCLNNGTVFGSRNYYYCNTEWRCILPKNAKYVADCAFKKNYMDDIVFPNALQYIGDYAFSSCSINKSITIPKSVTKIGNFAFQNCCYAPNIQLPLALTHCGANVLQWTKWEENQPDGLLYNGRTVVGYKGLVHNGDTWNIADGTRVLSSYLGTYCVVAGSGDTNEYMSEVNDLHVNVPASVKYVCNNAFSQLKNVEVTFMGDAPEFEEDVFQDSNVIINYPEGNATWDAVKEQGFKAASVEFNAFDVSKWFCDVPESAYFYKPVQWAVDNSITSGIAPGFFAPQEDCARKQVVTFLWRMAGKPEPKSTHSGFVDVPEDWYFNDAVCWAVENGITSGIDKTHFGPNESCARKQVVTFMWRAAGKPQPQSTHSGFADVPESYYYNSAVCWAVENKITSGIDAKHFAPDDNCVRGQIVTFLYRSRDDK